MSVLLITSIYSLEVPLSMWGREAAEWKGTLFLKAPL